MSKDVPSTPDPVSFSVPDVVLPDAGSPEVRMDHEPTPRLQALQEPMEESVTPAPELGFEMGQDVVEYGPSGVDPVPVPSVSVPDSVSLPSSDVDMPAVEGPPVQLLLENDSFDQAMLGHDPGFPALPGPSFSSLVPQDGSVSSRTRSRTTPRRPPVEDMDTTTLRRSIKRTPESPEEESRNLRSRTEEEENLALEHQPRLALTQEDSGALVPVEAEHRQVVLPSASRGRGARGRPRGGLRKMLQIIPPAYRRAGDPP